MKNINYDPKDSFYQRLRDLPQHERQEALKRLKKGSRVMVGGRAMSVKEFQELMG